MTPAEVQSLIGRLRRDMPRNQTAMALCDAAEALVANSTRQRVTTKPPMTRAEIQRNYRLRKKGPKSG